MVYLLHIVSLHPSFLAQNLVDRQIGGVKFVFEFSVTLYELEVWLLPFPEICNCLLWGLMWHWHLRSHGLGVGLGLALSVLEIAQYYWNAAAPKISELFSLEFSDLSGVGHFMNCLQIIQITDDTEDYFSKMAKFTLPLTSQGKRRRVTLYESILRLNFDQQITRFWTIYLLAQSLSYCFLKQVLVFCRMARSTQ